MFRASWWLEIEFKNVKLNAKIYVPPFEQATIDEPPFGGIDQFELLKLEYDGESCKKLFENSDMIDEINELIKSEWER